jgi:hypothetical protein
MSLLCLPDGLTCNNKQPIMMILLGMAFQHQLNCLLFNSQDVRLHAGNNSAP